MPSACLIFLLPPSLRVLEERLRGRKTDDEEVILFVLKKFLGDIGIFDIETASSGLETGMKLATVYSIITTSSANTTPASGVLNDAAIPAAVPQPTSVRMTLLGSAKAWPSRLPDDAPRKMCGPSRPTECPPTMAMAAPKNCRKNSRTVLRPW